MRVYKPHSNENRELKEVDVLLRWCCRPAPHLEPTEIFYFLHDPENPEESEEVSAYKIQRIVDERDFADPDLGIAGRMYIVDVEASENRTVRTVLWFDEEKWMVEAKKRAGGAVQGRK